MRLPQPSHFPKRGHDPARLINVRNPNVFPAPLPVQRFSIPLAWWPEKGGKPRFLGALAFLVAAHGNNSALIRRDLG